MNKVSENRTRLVAYGRVKAPFSTIEITYDTQTGESHEAAAAGLPQWNPCHSPDWVSPESLEPQEPDYDLIRKQQIEDRIARGGDL